MRDCIALAQPCTLAPWNGTTSPSFRPVSTFAIPRTRVNRAANLELVADLRSRLDKVAQAGGEEYVARHHERGKLLARERIQRLIDPASTFLELSPLAADGVYPDAVPERGNCYGHRRGLRARMRHHRKRCDRERWDVLPTHGEEAPSRPGNCAPEPSAVHLPRRFGRGVPSTAARRLPRPRPLRTDLLQPGPDERAGHLPGRRGHGLVHGRRRVCPRNERRNSDCPWHGDHLPGRPAARESGDRRGHTAEELGGADVHTRISGVADHLAEDDGDALRIVRGSSKASRARLGSPGSRATSEEPVHDPEELYGIVPPGSRQTYDVREVIARIVDGSRFQEFKARYGTTLVCGFAHIEGFPVGIVANNGILFSESALEGCAFHRTLRSAQGAARLSPEHHRVHGRQAVRECAALRRTARRW